MQTPVRLAVDLGTTHTVAVVGRDGQDPRTLLFDGSPLLASGVFLDNDGTLHTGRDAQRLAASEPERFEPHPKRRIGEGTVLLGEREVPVEELLATGLRRVTEEAAATGQRATEVVLTHPADWGPVRRATLERAAALAGIDNLRLVPEPIAAATYCASVLGQEIPRGGTVAIFDFGGGTFDVAVVRREDDEQGRLRTLAFGGLDDLGGLDVDMALAAHLGRIVAERDAELWERISNPETTADLRDRLAFWGEVRAAKEMLSRTSTAPVALPGHNPMGLHLTRDELTSLADPLVARAVDETRRTIERAGVAPSSLAALLLVGGSSRMPLVATRLHARLGVAPSVPEQPELPVAFGAFQHAVAEPEVPAGSSPPVTPPASAGPVSYAPFPVPDLRAAAPVQIPPAPMSPAAASPAATPGPDPEPSPVSQSAPSPAQPSPAAAPSPPPFTPPAGNPLPPTSPPSQFPPNVHTGPLPVGGPPPRSWAAVSVFSSIVLVIVIALVVALSQTDWDKLFNGLNDGVEGGLTGATGDGGGGLEGLDGTEGGASVAALELVAERELSPSGATAVTTAGGVAYLAHVAGGETTVFAVDADGAELWTASYDLEPTGLGLLVVEDLLIVDASASATDAGEDMRAAIDTADGALLWKRAWDFHDRNDVAFYGTDVLIEQRDGIYDNAAIRIDLTTGDEVWAESGPDDLFIIDDYRIKAETVWDVGEGAAGTLPPNSYTLFDNLAVTERFVDLDPDAGTAVLRKSGNGSSSGSGKLPFDSSMWTVFEGLAIGELSDDESPGRAVLAAYGIDGFAKEWTLEFEAGFSIQNVKACGPGLVCAALNHQNANDQYKSITVDIETGQIVWQIGTDWAFDENWYSTPSGMVFGEQVFDDVSEAALLDFDGESRSGSRLGTNVIAVQDDLVVTESFGTDSGLTVVSVATGAGTALLEVESRIEYAVVTAELMVYVTEIGQARVYAVPDLS
ncbi:Hsp70 family protein [Glycomyces sp. NRRL B-16210]|uniref:Hsp70 family protein n=1 Tax=Glycomyces sp. NRRL B-16210 TaxID=1463821 RepID=UPI00068C474F|nr:Hsp70 family protein [Glycomyces sp. NRRL B-16210]